MTLCAPCGVGVPCFKHGQPSADHYDPKPGPYGVADYRAPLTEFETRAGVIPIRQDSTPSETNPASGA